MKVEQFKELEKGKEPVQLKSIENGSVVRFHNHDFEEALKEDLFYYVISKKEKDKRVKLVCLANAEQIERDDVWLVHKHEAKMLITK